MCRLFRRRKKTALKNNYVNLTCTKCGSAMDADLDHVQVYCPFCGHEMFVRAGYYKDLVEQMKKAAEK